MGTSRGGDSVSSPCEEARVASAYASDLGLILTGVVFGFLGRFAQGEIDVTEIVPGIERAVFWLTAAYENRAAAQ
jgi:TetR/AcrR family transcriptional regulator, cholesterol catabolism regulator